VTLTPDTVVEAIQAGTLDGHLETIVSAMVDRVRAGAIEIVWRIRYDGDEWTQQSVTLGELKFAEQHCHVISATGGRRQATRVEINPRVTAEHALALIVAHLHKAQGVPLADAVKRAEAITATELDAMIDEFEVVRPPKDDSGPSTSS
jgi:hypothetical protein